MKRKQSITLSRLLATPVEYWIGCLYYKRNRWERAERQFAKALRRKPDHAESLFQRGMVEFKRERWEKAYEHMHAAISLEPEKTNWMVQFCQAARHLGGGNSSAVEICTKHIEDRISLDQNNAHLYSELAKIYRVQGRVWLEIESLKKALSLSKRDASLHLRLAQALEKMKRYGEAADAYAKAVDLNPANIIGHYRAGYCLEKSRKEGPIDPQRLASHYAKAIETDEVEDSKRFGIGVFHEKGNHWRFAANAYRDQLNARPGDAGLMFRLGTCHDRLYEWKEAEACYASAVAAEPQRTDWHARLGFVRERMGDYAKAAEAHAQVVRLGGGKDQDDIYRHARSLDLAGDHQAACVSYASLDPHAAVFQACPPSSAAGSTFSKSSIIRVFSGFKDKGTPRQRSVEEIRTALRKDATRSATWAELAAGLELLGDWQGAASAWRQAADRSPSHHAAYHHSLGRALMKTDRFREACEAFRCMRILSRNHGTSEEYFQKNDKFRKQASYVECFETLPIREKTVLFEAFHGRMMSCNPYALFLHMLEDPEYADWTHVWVMDFKSAIPQRFKGLSNVIFIPKESDAYLRFLASSRLLVNNVTFPSYFIRRDGQLYVNTWHGTPWKTLGRDVRNEFLVHGNVARNFLQASHIASPNEYTSEILIRSYNVTGIFKGSLMNTGSPRVDLTLFSPDSRKQEIRKELGIADGRKVVLYAPTWRGTLAAPFHEVEETTAVLRRIATLDCHLLFRGHYFVEDSLAQSGSVGRVVPAAITTNELLSVVDVLVTDYSSVFFDFLPTGRPIVFHLGDHENYISERGLYFGLDELPGPVVTDADQLHAVLTDLIAGNTPPHPKYESAARRFCSMEDGQACRRVLEFVFSDQPHPLPHDGKRTILMFGGHFHLNGITIALINLLNNLDYQTTRLVLALDTGTASILSESKAYIERLDDRVQLIPRVGTICNTPEERWILGEYNKRLHPPETPAAFEGFRHAHSREARRLFGSAHFDAAIEFSGYSGFFTALIACAPPEMMGYRTIYQHNEMHGEWKTKYPALERVFSLYGMFDHIISVSRSARDLNRDHLAEEFGLPFAKFDFAENLVNDHDVISRSAEAMEGDDEKQFFGTGKKVFISIGRLSVEKDHQKLIRAFAILLKSRTDVSLLILGDGPLSASLAMLVTELGLEGHVHLAGYRFNPFPYLLKADCFVFSSNYEGQGLVLLEAMILRRPIISVDIEVCRGVIENRSGLLVENSIEGLVYGMNEYLAGNIEVRDVNFDEYRKESLRMFYQKSCGFGTPDGLKTE